MTTIDDQIRMQQLLKDYSAFVHNVTQCYAHLVAGEQSKANELIALTAGQAMGFASRLGILHIKPKPSKHWEALGISRSTYYNDLRKAKQNITKQNTTKQSDSSA